MYTTYSEQSINISKCDGKLMVFNECSLVKYFNVFVLSSPYKPKKVYTNAHMIFWSEYILEDLLNVSI